MRCRITLPQRIAAALPFLPGTIPGHALARLLLTVASLSVIHSSVSYL